MSYIDNVSGEANIVKSVGSIQDMQTNGNTTIISATAKVKTTQATGKIGIAKINENNYNNLNNLPKINNVELKGNLTTEDLKLIYSMLLNLPTINGKTIVGDLTTEDLGIEASGGVKGVEVNKGNVVDSNGIAHINVPRDLGELTNNAGYIKKSSTSLEYYYTKTETDEKIDKNKVNIIDTFNYLKKFNNNDVYNANATNSSVDWVIQALLEALNQEYFVNINVVVNPLNYEVTSIDGRYNDIKHAFDIGGSIRCVCQLAQTNINVILNLTFINNNYAYFTTTIKADLGDGEMKYLIGLSIFSNSNILPKLLIDVLQ